MKANDPTLRVHNINCPRNCVIKFYPFFLKTPIGFCGDMEKWMTDIEKFWYHCLKGRGGGRMIKSIIRSTSVLHFFYFVLLRQMQKKIAQFFKL